MNYYLQNFQSTIEFLKFHDTPVNIIIDPEIIELYGMRIIDYMIKSLQQNYGKKIIKIIINITDDHAALAAAMKLGYKNINYSGKSEAAKAALKIYLNLY